MGDAPIKALPDRFLERSAPPVDSTGGAGYRNGPSPSKTKRFGLFQLLETKRFPLGNRKRRIPRTRLGEALRSGKWQRGSASFGLFSAKRFAISSNALHDSAPDSPAVAFPLEPKEKYRSRSASFPKAFQWRSASLRKNEKVRRRPPVLKEALRRPGARISRRPFSPWAHRGKRFRLTNQTEALGCGNTVGSKHGGPEGLCLMGD